MRPNVGHMATVDEGIVCRSRLQHAPADEETVLFDVNLSSSVVAVGTHGPVYEPLHDEGIHIEFSHL